MHPFPRTPLLKVVILFGLHHKNTSKKNKAKKRRDPVTLKKLSPTPLVSEVD